jgi:hypothetical protein
MDSGHPQVFIGKMHFKWMHRFTPGGNQHLGFQGHNQDSLSYITLSGSLAIGKHEDIFF